MTWRARARRNWVIGLAGVAIGAALIAVRNPQVLGDNLGQLAVFGLTCYALSLLPPKWCAIVFGTLSAALTALGYAALHSASDWAGMAGVVLILIGVQTAMATVVAVFGNLLLRRDPAPPDQA